MENLEVPDTTVPEGTVFGQVPVAGQQASEGSFVLIIISSGPAPTE